jgi:hypothetical protein
VASDELGTRARIFTSTQKLLACQYMASPMFIRTKRNIVLNASSERMYWSRKFMNAKKTITVECIKGNAPKKLLGIIK